MAVRHRLHNSYSFFAEYFIYHKLIVVFVEWFALRYDNRNKIV